MPSYRIPNDTRVRDSLVRVFSTRPVVESQRRLKALVEKRSEEHTSELQSPCNLVCRLLLEKKNSIEQMAVRPHSKISTPPRLPVTAPWAWQVPVRATFQMP